MGTSTYQLASNYRICTSTTRPSGGDVFDGLMIYETDTKRLFIYDGAWTEYARVSAWTSFTPTWTAVTPGTGFVTWGRYLLSGKTLSWQAGFKLGTGGALSGALQMNGPPGILVRDAAAGASVFGQVGVGYANDVSAATRYAGTFSSANGTINWMFRVVLTNQNSWNQTVPFTWAVDDEFYAAAVMEIV